MGGWSDSRRATPCIVVLAALVGPMVWGATPESKASAGVPLPRFVLADPDGKKHASSDLLKGGLVLVVTEPTYHAEKAQRAWGDVPRHSPRGRDAWSSWRT